MTFWDFANQHYDSLWILTFFFICLFPALTIVRIRK